MNITTATAPDKPLVSICCFTFNHKNYISRCLDSLLGQVTRFPFEILIHDDASMDGTQEIVKKYQARYPEKIVTIIQPENTYGLGYNPVSFTAPLVRGDYVAFCEGDDYWTDSQKLAKQIACLEADGTLSASAHSSAVQLGDIVTTQSGFWKFREFDGIVRLQDILGQQTPFHTSSFVCRTETLTDACRYHEKWKGTISGDWVLYMHAALRGGIRVFPDYMSTYRLHEGGITRESTHKNQYRFLRNRWKMWNSFKEFNKLRDDQLDALIAFFDGVANQELKQSQVDLVFFTRQLSADAIRRVAQHIEAARNTVASVSLTLLFSRAQTGTQAPSNLSELLPIVGGEICLQLSTVRDDKDILNVIYSQRERSANPVLYVDLDKIAHIPLPELLSTTQELVLHRGDLSPRLNNEHTSPKFLQLLALNSKEIPRRFLNLLSQSMARNPAAWEQDLTSIALRFSTQGGGTIGLIT